MERCRGTFFYLSPSIKACPSRLDANGMVTPSATKYKATPQIVAGCTRRREEMSYRIRTANNSSCGPTTEMGNIDCAPGQRAMAGATRFMEAMSISRLCASGTRRHQTPPATNVENTSKMTMSPRTTRADSRRTERTSTSRDKTTTMAARAAPAVPRERWRRIRPDETSKVWPKKARTTM